MEDIKEAMKMIKEECPEKIVFKDEYQTIWANGLGYTKIQLTEKGKKILANFGGFKF